jgi:small subunit ribosomal protein S8
VLQGGSGKTGVQKIQLGDAMKHDLLADMLSIIKNMEDIGRKEATVPSNKLAEGVLKIMQKHNYIGKYSPAKGNKFRVELEGKINNCNVIKPRFSVQKNEFIKWEKRFLPANNIGILVLSTTKGVMDHHTAKKEGVGGQLLGFVY